MKVSLVTMTPKPLDVIAVAASKCYDTKVTNKEGMIKALYRSGHTSVFEHINFTFDINDVSRACLMQLSRHRFISMTVRSQRYCIESGVLPIAPLSVSSNKEAFRVWLGLQRASDKAYRLLLKQGIKAEDARSVLTNAHPTTLVLTLNLRSLIHICNERLCTRAQHEIRELVQNMADIVSKKEPLFSQFLVAKCEKTQGYPLCPEEKGCGKHPELSKVYSSELNDPRIDSYPGFDSER